VRRQPGYLRFLFAASLGMMSVSAFAVGGNAWLDTPWGGTTPAPNGTRVKLCYADGTAAAASGQGQCYTTSTSGQTWGMTVPTGRYYWMFVWNDAYDWGSENSIAWGAANGQAGTLLLAQSFGYADLYSPPRPHKPLAVYPANGAKQVPLSFTLKWTSGLDSYRIKSGWPVTYDIYAYGAGASEQLILSNIPCNPDSSGNCTYPITNLAPVSLHYWRVVAKLNPQLGSPGNPYYTNSSARFSLTTQGTTYSLSTSAGYFVGADNCGGSTVNAKATSVGSCQTLKIIEVNNGTLDSGDQVAIQIYATPWNFTAVNGGGGALKANSQGGGSYEIFTISKTSGSGALQNGDEVTLRAFNGQYCSAENDGGDVVNCNRSAIGPWETFTFGIIP
jgi:hypothetical protein